jgi:hypothetical protein
VSSGPFCSVPYTELVDLLCNRYSSATILRIGHGLEDREIVVRLLAGVREFLPSILSVPCWANPALILGSTGGYFVGCKAAGALICIYLHTVMRLGMSEAHSYCLYVFMPYGGVKVLYFV